MQCVRRTETLDRRDLIAIVHEGEVEAREHALTVDMDRTRAALPMIATFLGAGEHNRFANAIQQRCAWINIQFVILAIDAQRDWHRTLDHGPADFAFVRWFATRLCRQIRRYHTRCRSGAARL